MPIHRQHACATRQLSPEIIIAIAACLVLFTMLARAAASSTIDLSGKVIGGSGKHTIYVALWVAQSFLVRPIQQIRIEPTSGPDFHFRIPVGRWALRAFEDENENGVLDMGHFGPKEPSGFWRPFRVWRKPHFDDVATQVDHDTTDADVKLRR
jgi:uncharacterized protein (DUF2141 family)